MHFKTVPGTLKPTCIYTAGVSGWNTHWYAFPARFYFSVPYDRVMWLSNKPQLNVI